MACCRIRFLTRQGRLLEAYGSSNPFWRARYLDGDWEELIRQGIEEGKQLATSVKLNFED